MLALLITAILVVKIVFSLIASMPTDAYTHAGNWLNARFLRARENDLTRALTASGQRFHPDTSFLPQGVGLAVDENAKLLFIATREKGRVKSIVLPFAALLGQTSGGISSSGFYDYYVDVRVNSGPNRFWRLLCGDDSKLAEALEQTLATIYWSERRNRVS